MQQLTGDYPAAAASQQQALALFRDLGNLYGQAYALNCLGVVQQETGDYPAAAASQQQALALFGDLGNLLGQAEALNYLGVVQQETGDYPAAAASHQQALALFRDLGNRLGQAEALNRLGELSSRTSATRQAREYHTQALAIARDFSAALEEARALEGLGQSHLQDGNPGQAAAHLRQALTIYQRIGAPAARRVQETLHNHRLASALPVAPPGRHTDGGLGTRPARSATEQPDLRGTARLILSNKAHRPGPLHLPPRRHRRGGPVRPVLTPGPPRSGQCQRNPQPMPVWKADVVPSRPVSALLSVLRRGKAPRATDQDP